jgi:hypothetical protein
MTILNALLFVAVVANLACMVWNITRARAFNRALEATAKERAELLVKVNQALAMPRPVQIVPSLSAGNMPGWRSTPPDGQATMSGTTIPARGGGFG